ncbi:MAG: UvrB/UvrC motif-containing protein [Clostridiaceae bacterium]|nr:UvrB/UvrC motif-containing protein [Clostridiaceae bacterium]
MVCQQCNERKATVHMTKILQGKKEEIHLCEQCAQEKETLNFENSFSIHNFLAGLLDGTTGTPFNPQYAKEIQCSECGHSYDRFKQVGKLNCSQCYQQFKQKLIPLIRKVQGNVRHTGKVPKRAGGIIQLKRELKDLRSRLAAAVEEQEFERAAELRDEIKALEARIEEM